MKGVVTKIVVLFFCVALAFQPALVWADDLEAISRQLEDTKKALESLQQANENNKKTLESVNSRIDKIKQEVTALEIAITRKEKQLRQGESALVRQKNLLDERVVSYYKNSGKHTDMLMMVLTSENLGDSLRDFFYQKKFLDEDKRNIVRIVSYINKLEDLRDELRSDRARLQPIKDELNKQSLFLAREIEKANNYEGELKTKIQELSEKQKAILSARSGGGVTSVGNVPTVGDEAATIAFKSRAPANSFAVFSFGAHTHRNGMSQYGANARAKAGQSYQDILKKYYPSANLEQRSDLPSDISVDGHGSMPFEDRYLLGIAEMPSSWHPEALKAQAVAARTYAWRRVRANGSICATEACQVYLASKADNPPDAWRQAVQATRGMVLTNNGEPVITQYSSTAGGYLNTSGWDTTDNSGDGAWTSRAYESIEGSPWFYRAWYRRGYRDDSDSCGRSHPWLSQEEMADIVNAWIVRKNPNGADANRILPVTIGSCPIGGASGSPYSMSELRELAEKSGGAVTSISGVTVLNNNNGQTTQVRFETNRGTITIPGGEFKETFNIRAPGYIAIPQAGFAFFNIEKT
ncbi:MAG: SpoIID/LytB domain-containing protein [Patescibacteria group bacterium]|nr:SpoIID/LytB domain-containing protein [Patescibacteria group bacterium]